MHSDQQNTSGLEDFASVIAFPLQQKIQGERSRARHRERERQRQRETERDFGEEEQEKRHQKHIMRVI